jgi:hypothetical protein
MLMGDGPTTKLSPVIWYIRLIQIGQCVETRLYTKSLLDKSTVKSKGGG